ncbi:hypothetical protein HUJ04_011927 [Dendroctonus ponderosae]|nr:hypothetical protein HUJ04_011927 [Dendroctonus ponderosae]
MGIEPPGSYYLIKMVRRKELFRTTLVALVCLLLIALYQKNPSPLIRSRPATFQAIKIEDDQPLEEHSLKEVIINAQRSRLRKELYDFKFPSNRPLTNFAMEDGGQPIRTIIFSTWRSGSTFLGVHCLQKKRKSNCMSGLFQIDNDSRNQWLLKLDRALDDAASVLC